MSEQTIEITLPPSLRGERVDKAIALCAPELSRARVQALLRQGHIMDAGGGVPDASRKVAEGERYTIRVPAPEPAFPQPEDIPLDIVFEDKHLLVLNKQAGLTVHPAPGNRDGTLVNALLAHCGETLSGIGGVARPGIVHRLDKDTSGLMVVAKCDAAHRHLSQQLHDRTLSRTYLALCRGLPVPQSGSVEGNIGRDPKNRQKMAMVKQGGKEAKTHYRVLECYTGIDNAVPLASLVECLLESGRTHQIRVHMAHLGHGIVGDAVYGGRQRVKSLPEALAAFPRQALHAARLRFVHPASGEEMGFGAALPVDMQALLDGLRSKAV